MLLIDAHNKQDEQFIIGNHLISRGIVIALFCGEELYVQGDYILGWKPLGKELEITEAVGINCIATSSILNDLVNMIANRAKNKGAISDVELKEAWETIGDIIQTFDYDNLIYLLGELAGYKLEEKDRQKLQLLQEAAQVPDWERLKELIK